MVGLPLKKPPPLPAEVYTDGTIAFASSSKENQARCEYIFEQAGGVRKMIDIMRADDDKFWDFGKKHTVDRLPKEVTVNQGPSEQMLDALKQLRAERAKQLEGVKYSVTPDVPSVMSET